MIILEWDLEYQNEDYFDDPYDNFELDHNDKKALVDEWISSLSKQQMVDIINDDEELLDKFEKYKKENGVTNIEELNHSDISQFILDIDVDELVDYFVDEVMVSDRLYDMKQSAREHDREMSDQDSYYYSTRGV